MFMRKWMILGLLITLSGTAAAQKIRGRVTDQKGAAIEAALVWLTNPTDSIPLAHTQTNEQGEFTLSATAPSALHISSLGYKAQHIPIERVKMDFDIGTIILSDEYAQLAAVEITAARSSLPLVRRAGKLTLNVEKTLLAQGGNAYDILKQLPGITVDEAAKSIRLNGRSNLLVLIDGKQTYLQQSDLIAMLRATASSGIKSIEVMSNPTAQFDAEGSGAVINIITKRGVREGYQLSLNAGVGYWFNLKNNLDATLQLGVGKLSLWSSYNHQLGNHALLYGGSRWQDGRRYETISHDTDKRSSIAANIGAEYSISPEHSVRAQLSGSSTFGPGIISSYNHVYEIDPPQPLYSVYSEADYQKQHGNRYTLALSYRYTPSQEHTLSIDADYGLFRGYLQIHQPNIFYSPAGLVDSARTYRTYGHRDIMLYGLSAGYTGRILGGNLAIGAKTTRVASSNDFRKHEHTGSVLALDARGSSTFDYTESFLAGYTQFDRAVGERFRFSLGLRLEHTRSRGRLHPLAGSGREASDIVRSHTGLFPSAGLTYTLDEASALSVSLGRRIDRPQYSTLNPIDEAFDGFTSWRGNPFLLPQKTWRTELAWQRTRSSAALGYSYTDDYFVNVLDTIPGGRTVVMPMNLGVQQHLSFALSQGFALFGGWDVNLSGTVFWQENQMAYTLHRRFARRGWGASCSAQASIPLWLGIRSEWGLNYHSPRLGSSTDVSASTWGLDVALQRSFLDERLSVKLALSDAFWTNRWDGVNTTDAFIVRSYGYGESRAVRLNCSYRIGRKPQARAHSSALENEYARL